MAAYDETDVLRSLDWEHARYSQSPLRGIGLQAPGGPLVVDAYGSAGTAILVDPAELPKPRLVWQADTVTAAAQGTLASLGQRATGTLTIRDTALGAVVASTTPSLESCGSPGHTGWLHPDARHVLVASADAVLCLWDMFSGEGPAPLANVAKSTQPQATRVAVAPGARVAATYDGATRTVSIWDTRAGDPPSTLPVGEVAALALGSHGERLAIVDQKMELVVLSTTSGEELARAKLSGPRPLPLQRTGLAVAPDGRTIAVNRVTHVEIWRLAVGESEAANALQLETVLLLPIAPRNNCPAPAAFSTDGGRLAAGCDSAVVWDMTTRREVFRLVPDAEGRIGGAPAWIDEGFALSADGRAILTTHGVWDVPDPAPTSGGPTFTPWA